MRFSRFRPVGMDSPWSPRVPKWRHAKRRHRVVSSQHRGPPDSARGGNLRLHQIRSKQAPSPPNGWSSACSVWKVRLLTPPSTARRRADQPSRDAFAGMRFHAVFANAWGEPWVSPGGREGNGKKLQMAELHALPI